ncbi:iron ABC transporter permease [Streptomyces sp. NP160]|uniref:FecCD family ABC transporter permease n=1 Tax=Streptomyces sp. NP160 TaxID=2586637 RepID=UPI001117D308|nr:iron ABC transporter permease [Streptomyces sp. NP160]TNM59409.1 iron ABC transporter permease [Streptomyces sp. NP160]
MIATDAAARPARPAGGPADQAAPGAGGRRRSPGHRGAVVVVLLGLVVLAVAAGLALGSKALPLPVVVDVLRAGPAAAAAPGASEASVVVWQLRVPRTLLGLLAGAALGVAGGLMQGHTRNPLADPGLLGVTQGAALAVVVAAVVLGADGVLPPAVTVTAALVGAGAGALVVLGIALGGARSRGRSGSGADPLTLVLAGAAVTALLGSLVQAVVLADATGLQAYRFWAVGAVTGTTEVVALAAPVAAVGLVLALLGARGLDLLALGEDVARGAGLRVGPARLLGVAGVVALVGAATAACGPVAFVGLVVPHLARALVGPVHRWLLPVAALVGAVLVVAADVVGRLVVSPAEVPVGVVLAVLGGPAFVVLVRRRRLVAL